MFCPSCGKELQDGSQFCHLCGKPTVAAPAAATPQATGKTTAGTVVKVIGYGALFGVLFALLLFRYVASQIHPSPTNHTPTGPAATVPTPVMVPGSAKFFTGQLIVKAGGYVFKKFTVESNMINFRITGSFDASGGTGNDIAAVLADEDEFQNWINGHQAKVFYSTGKITTAKVEIGPLAPGRYIFAFSNTFSALTSKQVFAEIEASWITRQ